MATSVSAQTQTQSATAPMSWERYAGVGGIVFVIALLGTVFAGAQINPTASPATVASSLLQHRSGELTTVYLQLFAAIPLLVFLVGLRATLYRGEGESPVLAPLAFVTALIGLALVLAAHGILGTLEAYVVKGSGAGTVRAAYSLYEGVFTVSDLFLGAFLLASSLVILRSHVLPRWTGWAGIVGGVCLVLDTFSFSNPQSILGLFGFVGFILMLVWVLSISVSMLRNRVAV